MSLTRVPVLIALLTAFSLLGAACGSDADGGSLGIASLEDAAVADVPDDSTVDDDRSPEDAALAFSECIRGEGIDFPDIGVDANGNPDLRDAFQDAAVDPRSPEFQDASEVCRPLLDGVGFGGGGRAALGDNPELQDAFVAFSDCIRSEGFDVGDLTLGGGPGAGGQDGGTPPADGEGPPRGQGQGQGGFGDRNSRFADNLGLDANDPAVEAALDVCAPIIDAAFSAAGVGPGN